MLRPRKYTLGLILDTVLLWLTLAVVWGAVFVLIVAILFWY